MAKRLPKPFQRDSIDLGGAKKVWQDLPAVLVEVGDIVADYGLVTNVESWDEPAEDVRGKILPTTALTFKSGKYLLFNSDHILFTFHQI